MQRFGGFVAKYMGDGVLVYFGYPQAHEDDAERAVRSGLGADRGGGTASTYPSRSKCASASAPGWSWSAILSDRERHRSAAWWGRHPNLAARLQAAAAPNSIVIGQTTRRLLGNLFEYRELGGIEVKGFAAPVQAWQVVRRSAVESRFEALRAASSDAARGARGGVGSAAAPLGAAPPQPKAR